MVAARRGDDAVVSDFPAIDALQQGVGCSAGLECAAVLEQLQLVDHAAVLQHRGAAQAGLNPAGSRLDVGWPDRNR